MKQAVRDLDTPRGLMWLAALLYAVFVVYGSLVPLEYRALPWETAVARFEAIPFLELGIGSRADWVANLLLFMPLTFIWMGAVAAGNSTAKMLLASLLIIPLAVALSVSIEFTQLFFPQRTVSQNDILAESLGGLIGVLIWWGTGHRFVAWLQSWQQAHAQADLVERLAWVYLAGVLVYNVMPLDLTISLVEIFHKFQDGKVNLVPFGRVPAGMAEAIYEVATDALIWVPLAVLWRIDGTRSIVRVWGMTVVTAVVLEGLQLFVFSRVSDVTDIITAAAGGLLGGVLGGYLAKRKAPVHSSSNLLTWIPFVAASVWMVALLFVFWFPFDFRTDGAFIKSRLDFIYRVPFTVYYFGTEYRAITEVFRKTLFFAPLGGLLAWAVIKQPWRWRGPLFGLSMAVLLLMPAVIELGQVMLPEKFADTTDWLLAWLGGMAGYGVTRRLLRAPLQAHRPPDPVAEIPKEATAVPLASPKWAGTRWHLPVVLSGLTVLFWVAAHAAFVPYNVREMLRQDEPWLSALLLAVAVYGLAAWPVWLARRRISGVARVVQLPLGMIVYGVSLFLLVNAAVPDESLHDLVGSPVLNWSWRWELGLRWVALAAIPGALMYLAAQTVRRWRGLQMRSLHFWMVLPILLVAYWGVVTQAATDNLTELIATPKPLAFVALCVGLYGICLAAALWASPLSSHQRGVRWLWLAASLPLTALCLYLGTASELDKYGQQFSALQFLLSTDRQHYASQMVIWLRYSVVHFLAIGALAFIQWPYYRDQPHKNN